MRAKSNGCSALKLVSFASAAVNLTDEEADEAAVAPLPTPKPYLLYVGAFEPRKGILSLLDMFELLTSSSAGDFGLILVGHGRGEYVEMMKAKVARSRRSERIEIIQRASREQTLSLISNATVLVLPTIAEGFGLPVLEAIALGTPVVASDIPAIRSWAEDAVFYAPPDRPRDWIEPIESAARSDAAKRRLGQTFARRYRWQTCAEGLIRF